MEKSPQLLYLRMLNLSDRDRNQLCIMNCELCAVLGLTSLYLPPYLCPGVLWCIGVNETTSQRVNECHGVSSVSGVSGVSSVHKGKRFSFSFWFSFIVVSQAMSPPNQARSATNLQFGVSGVVRYETYLKGREWSVWNTCNSLMMTCHNRPSEAHNLLGFSLQAALGCAFACM